MANKYRRRAATIEAIQWTGINMPEVKEFVTNNRVIFTSHGHGDPTWHPSIITQEGDVDVQVSDWIVKTGSGNYSVVSAERFKATYDPVEGNDAR
jgi:hypothetical protein